MTPESQPYETGENFADLLEESLPSKKSFEDSVVKGRVVSIDSNSVLIDVGLKSEGRVSVREFAAPGQECDLQPGDEVEVFVERMENKSGEAMLSRDKARRAEAWTAIEKTFQDEENVTGVIFGRVKGGFTVDLSGALAFLPGSQVDIRPVRDITPLMGEPQPFRILKMDRRRGNIVVSRRAVLEESRASDRAKLMSKLEEGQILEGVVKNITDYGAFVDLGGVDGLLHVTDMAWRRINHPSEALNVGETVKVKVTRFNAETQRISLGMKQLLPDPWEAVEVKYPKGAKFKGRVANIADYGAFVELEPGIEGLVHVSEMSWTKKNVHPGKIVSTSQEIEVLVLDVDSNKRRISLGLKQCSDNPWQAFADNYPQGSEYEGEIKNITEFGLFVGLPGDVDGMIHLSDLDWKRPGEEAIKDYNKGDMIKVKILEVDAEKERVSLGVKQLSGDPFEDFSSSAKKGDSVTCTVTAVESNLLEVSIASDIRGVIRKAELSKDRGEQRTDRFAVGERLDAKIQKIDRKDRKVSLSIKARESDEEQEAMAQYGSSDSGALLGDILGAALDKAKAKKAEKAAEDKASEGKDAKAKDADSADGSETASKAKAKAKPKPKAKSKAGDDADPKDKAGSSAKKASAKKEEDVEAKPADSAKDADSADDGGAPSDGPSEDEAAQ